MQGALVRKLQHYLPLTDAEREALASLEQGERHFRSGEVVLREGEVSDKLYVVSQGWLYASARLSSGDRQILRLHFPGDLMGTSSIAWAETATTLTSVSPSTVSTFPRAALCRIFAERQRLAALFYAVSAAEHVSMSDRLMSLGRTDGATRIATLFLDILSRLRITEPNVLDRFELPLSQVEIADAVGLTKVHVNRTLRVMEDNRMIERQGRVVRIVDESQLHAFAGFKDRHQAIATDWFPEAA